MRDFFKPPTPIVGVAFEILEKCNLFCDFCVRNAHKKLTAMIDVTQFEARVQRATQAFGSLQMIAITGGEPMLHPDVENLVSVARKYASNVCLTTNGTVLSERKLRAIAAVRDFNFLLSLDGSIAALHDSIRGRPGAFDRLIDFAGMCNDLKVPFLVNMTVSERNFEYVYDTIKLASHLGARDITVALVKPEGRGKVDDSSQVTLTATGYQFARAKADFGRSDFRVRFGDPLSHLFDDHVLAGSRNGCGANSGVLHIQCDGNILICTACTESLGNIDDHSFDLRSTVNTDHRIKSVYGRKDLSGVCGSCDYLDVCGGCRCRAFYSEDGFLGPDILCPKHRSEQRKEEIGPVVQQLAKRLEHPDFSAFDAPSRQLLKERLFSEVFEYALESGALALAENQEKILVLGDHPELDAHLLAMTGARVDWIGSPCPGFAAMVVNTNPRYLGALLRDNCLPSFELYDRVLIHGLASVIRSPIEDFLAIQKAMKLGGILGISHRFAVKRKVDGLADSFAEDYWFRLNSTDILALLRTNGYESVVVSQFSRKGDLRYFVATRSGVSATDQKRVGSSIKMTEAVCV